MGLEVRPQSEAHDGYIAVVHDLPKLVDLVHSKELTLVHYDHIALALKVSAKPLVSIGLRGEDIRPGRQADPAGKHMLPVPHIGAGLQQPHPQVVLLVIVFGDQGLGGLAGPHSAVFEI